MSWSIDPVAAVLGVLGLIILYFTHRSARLSDQLQYYTPFRAWAAQVVDLLSDVEFLSICDPQQMPSAPYDFFTKRGEMMAKLSALIDRGKMVPGK